MRGKLAGICIVLMLFCSGSTYQGILQPHFTLTTTSVELGMDEPFDPYAYVLKNMQPIDEADKDYLVIEGSYPEAIPGEYEITYNQYMRLHVTIKDTQAPDIQVSSFDWGQGIPFIWNGEMMERIHVSDNFTSEEKLRETIVCDEFDTAYLGERKASCSVVDEAGNKNSITFHVNIIKASGSALSEQYKVLNDLPYSNLQQEEIVQVLAYVNEARAAEGLQPVELGNRELMNIAHARAQEVQELYSHDRPNGEVCFTILDEHGYTYEAAGENVAKGQQSAWEVMQDWMESETHRTIILTPEFTHLGISVQGEGENKVWILIFVH